MNCWKCYKHSYDASLKIGFRAVCMHCDIDLHVCKNCKYYSPGKPNDCIIPDTETIYDPERSNLCEEFKAKEMIINFDMNQKKQFNDLFK